jgi:hypothetical protein
VRRERKAGTPDASADGCQSPPGLDYALSMSRNASATSMMAMPA